MAGKSERWGFSMAEVIVTIAIIAILVATLIPQFNSYLEKGRVAKLEETLVTLTGALRDFDRNTGQYPKTLFPLVRAAALSDANICGTSFTAAVVNSWRGPYLMADVTASGIPVEAETISTILARSPTSALSSQAGELLITVGNASAATATAVQLDVDGDGDFTKGPIRWNAVSGMTYSLPIAGC